MARRDRAGRLFRDVLGTPVDGFQTPGGGWRLGDGVGDFIGEIIDLDLTGDYAMRGPFVQHPEVLGGQPGRDEFRNSISEAGLEYVAVYAPYSFYGKRWGIYFFDDGMYGLSVDLAADPLLARSPGRVVSSLYRIIREHEWLHYRVELAAALTRSVLSINPYPDYLAAYRCRPGSSDCLEEAVATAIELRVGRLIDRRVAAGLERLAASMPAGYRDHARFRHPSALLAGQLALTRRLLPGSGPMSGELLSRDFAPSLQASVPARLVSTGSVPAWFKGLLLARGRAKPTFPQVLAHANRRGAVVPGGRHPFIVKMPGKRGVPLPSHSSMKTVPDEIIGQLARLFDLARPDYLAAVLGR